MPEEPAEPRLGARGHFGGVDFAQPELVEGFEPPCTLTFVVVAPYKLAAW